MDISEEDAKQFFEIYRKFLNDLSSEFTDPIVKNNYLQGTIKDWFQHFADFILKENVSKNKKTLDYVYQWKENREVTDAVLNKIHNVFNEEGKRWFEYQQDKKIKNLKEKMLLVENLYKNFKLPAELRSGNGGASGELKSNPNKHTFNSLADTLKKEYPDKESTSK